jgi:hypothetical protein
MELNIKEVDIVVLALQDARISEEDGYSEEFTNWVNLALSGIIEKFLEYREELIDKDGTDIAADNTESL